MLNDDAQGRGPASAKRCGHGGHLEASHVQLARPRVGTDIFAVDSTAPLFKPEGGLMTHNEPLLSAVMWHLFFEFDMAREWSEAHWAEFGQWLRKSPESREIFKAVERDCLIARSLGPRNVGEG